MNLDAEFSFSKLVFVTRSRCSRRAFFWKIGFNPGGHFSGYLSAPPNLYLIVWRSKWICLGSTSIHSHRSRLNAGGVMWLGQETAVISHCLPRTSLTLPSLNWFPMTHGQGAIGHHSNLTGVPWDILNRQRKQKYPSDTLLSIFNIGVLFVSNDHRIVPT